MTDKNIVEIVAEEVTIEVTDQRTGRSFKRTLPLDYYENANGILLKGENVNAQPSEIVFYSNQGLEKLGDIMGQGADEGRHEH